MTTFKKIASVLVSVALMTSLTACSMVSVDDEKDANQVVAVVGDTEILKQDFMEQYEAYTAAYGYDESYLSDSANAETVAQLKQYILDSMVQDEAAYQYAIANGMDLTDEEKQEQSDNLAETVESYKQTIREQVEEEAAADPSIDVEAEVAAREEEQLSQYDEQYVQDTIRYYVLQNFADSVRETVNVTEEDAKEYYDLQVENQQLMLDNMSTYEMNIAMGNTVYVYPEGTKAVKHILIAIPDDKQTEIATYRSEGDDETADAVLAEELAKIQSTADEVLAKVKAGEDFDTLIEEYGEDPGMTQEPAMTKGYYVYPDDSNYVESFVDASVALENVGDTSDLVASDYGYHIIELIAIPDQVTPFDEVKDDLIDTLQSNQESSAIMTKKQELVEEMNAKEYYDRL
jgi:peptidyl-prolyl cis-trans isomerase C